MITRKRFLTVLSKTILAVPIIVTATIVAAAQSAPSGQFINILTVTIGGIFYPLGGALDGMPIPLHPGAGKLFKGKGLIKWRLEALSSKIITLPILLALADEVIE